MAWSNATLGDLLSGSIETINNQLAKANTALDSIQGQLDKITQISGALGDQLSTFEDMVYDILESGIYYIVLSPSQGSWYTRLVTALDAPSNSSSVYTALVSGIYIAPNLAGTLESFNTIKDSFKNIIPTELPFNPISGQNGFELPPIELPDLNLPDFNTLDPFSNENLDKWTDLSLGNIFSGIAKSTENGFNSAFKTKSNLDRTLTMIGKKRQNLQDQITNLTEQLDRINAGGFYLYNSAPTTGISWSQKLQATDPNRPPINVNDYTCGFCAVIVAPDFATASQKFTKLTNLVSKVF